MFTRKIGLLLVIMCAVLSGCASQAINQAKDIQQKGHTAKDIHEETSGLNELPQFLTGKQERVINTYAVVAKFPDLFKAIPCYKSCDENSDHSSSLDSFIDKINEDGSVVWNDHATRNEVCLDIASKIFLDFTKHHKTIKEIKEELDQTYKE